MQVDMTALKQMGENDLKELGIPMVCLMLGSSSTLQSFTFAKS
ncbi:hypothetical protein Pint_23077 [Pistacia integerrima]|uniref:Uncharacterized protein n=1 Tax=Pistacia integerrima TaxID=434235 RepID=A0ACC0YIA3_9ROSI|nr:hypothetical protein Pint_23077 [Pistacia integerrima]